MHIANLTVAKVEICLLSYPEKSGNVIRHKLLEFQRGEKIAVFHNAECKSLFNA